MANVEKLSIALTPELAGLLRAAVESAEYATTSEVVREALRERKQRRILQQGDSEELRRLWAAGLTGGPGRFENMDAIKNRRADARRAIRHGADGDDGGTGGGGTAARSASRGPGSEALTLF